nr:MAG TPA_asm: hypothetical protein [Caudoviricetes sp.]
MHQSKFADCHNRNRLNRRRLRNSDKNTLQLPFLIALCRCEGL